MVTKTLFILFLLHVCGLLKSSEQQTSTSGTSSMHVAEINVRRRELEIRLIAFGWRDRLTPCRRPDTNRRRRYTIDERLSWEHRSSLQPTDRPAGNHIGTTLVDLKPVPARHAPPSLDGLSSTRHWLLSPAGDVCIADHEIFLFAAKSNAVLG